jgi:hypothetical protein
VTRQQHVREANVRVIDQAERLGIESRLPLLCECEDPECREYILLRPEDYRSERAHSLVLESARANALARTLRAAYNGGGAMRVRCAWCGRLEVKGERLELEALRPSQEMIVRRLRDQASHGICPPCLDVQMESARMQRALRPQARDRAPPRRSSRLT